MPTGKEEGFPKLGLPGFHTENEAVHVSILKKGTVTGRPRQYKNCDQLICPERIKKILHP